MNKARGELVQSRRNRANVIAIKSADAYMADNYGNFWAPCAEYLVTMGLTNQEVEAILRSKHMRRADDSEGKGNGKQTNSAAFKRYVWARIASGFDWNREARQMALETFGSTEEM